MKLDQFPKENKVEAVLPEWQQRILDEAVNKFKLELAELEVTESSAPGMIEDFKESAKQICAEKENVWRSQLDAVPVTGEESQNPIEKAENSLAEELVKEVKERLNSPDRAAA